MEGEHKIQQTDRLNAEIKLLTEVKKIVSECYEVTREKAKTNNFDSFDTAIYFNSLLNLKIGNLQIEKESEKDCIFKRLGDLNL